MGSPSRCARWGVVAIGNSVHPDLVLLLGFLELNGLFVCMISQTRYRSSLEVNMSKQRDLNQRQILSFIGNRYVVFGPADGSGADLMFSPDTDAHVIPRIANENEFDPSRLIDSLKFTDLFVVLCMNRMIQWQISCWSMNRGGSYMLK